MRVGRPEPQEDTCRVRRVSDARARFGLRQNPKTVTRAVAEQNQGPGTTSLRGEGCRSNPWVLSSGKGKQQRGNQMQSVPWLKLPGQNQAQSAGQGSNDTETRCCLLRARNFPGRIRPSQQGRKATARKPDAVCSVPVASRAAEKLLNNAETCCYPPSDLQRQLKGTGDRVRRLVSSSSGSCNEHGSQEFLPHDTEHTSRICPTGAG